MNEFEKFKNIYPNLESEIKTLDIQLILLGTKTNREHVWILITTIDYNGSVIEVGTRHRNYQLIEAIKGHYTFIKQKYGVDYVHRCDVSFFNWHIVPQVLKTSDFEDYMASPDEEIRLYTECLLLPF